MKNHRRILAAFLVLLLVILTGCSSNGNDVSNAYNQAFNDMKKGDYAAAVEKLSGISFYEDSIQLAQYCRAHVYAGKGEYKNALDILSSLGSYRDSTQYYSYYTARAAEENAENPYGRAYAAYLYDRAEISGFCDAEDRSAAIRSSLYLEGTESETAEAWMDTYNVFAALENYLDSYYRCQYALGRINEADGEKNALSFADAVKCYVAADYYSDSAERINLCIAAVYQEAEKLIERGEFDSAEELYKALGEKCDEKKLSDLQVAREKADEERKQQQIAEAESLTEKGGFDEARAIYEELGETEKVLNVQYLQAASFEKSGKVEEAAAIYLSISRYKDSREKHYLLGLGLKESDPVKASSILLEDQTYQGAEEVLYEIADTASNRGNYALSISIFDALGSQKDCRLRMRNDLYLYGRQLLTDGQNDTAAAVFERIAGIGSADLYKNMAHYAAAVHLEEEGSFESAAEAFEQIADYEDAAERARNCWYEAGNKKQEEGMYADASVIFLELKGYRDSAERTKECKYLQAQRCEKEAQWDQAISIYEQLKDYAESVQRCKACYNCLGETQLVAGKAEAAYQSFKAGDDSEAQARAAFAIAETKTAEVLLEEALGWYQKATAYPETEERTAMIAQNLLNMEEDSLSEQYASVVADSEKAKPVLYALALRSLERKDEEAAMRQMKKAGDNADATERFKAMLNNRVEILVAEGKYDDAIFLCNTYGEQEQADEIAEVKAQQEEAERQKALEAEEAEHKAKAREAEQLLLEEKYEEAAAIYSEIGEMELAEKALIQKRIAEEAIQAAEKEAQMEAEKAEKEKVQARLDEAAVKLAAGNFDDALEIYQELNDQEMVNEVIFQKASALGQPDLYMDIIDYKDSRELHYLAGKALLDTDPENAFRIIAADIGYSDSQSVLYNLADREVAAGNYSLASSIFMLLADQPLNPANPLPDCRMRAIQSMYQYGLSLKEQGEFELAADIFDQLSSLNSAQEHAKESYYAIAERLEDDEKYTQAAVAFEALGDFSNASKRVKQNKYAAAIKMIEGGNYELAETALIEIGDYEDAYQQIKRCRYLIGKQQMNLKNYEEARQIFNALGAYEDAGTLQLECRYLEACSLMDQQKYEKAAEGFVKIAEYKDAEEKTRACYSTLGDMKINEAESLLNARNTVQAAEAYQNAYELYKIAGNQDKADSAAYLTAASYQAMGELDTSVEWYAKGRKQDKSIASVEEIAEYYRMTEQNPKEDHLRQYIAWMKAENAMDLGDFQHAAENYRLITDQIFEKPREKEAYYYYGEKLCQDGQYKDAVELLELANDYSDAKDILQEAKTKYEEELYIKVVDRLIKEGIGDREQCETLVGLLLEGKTREERQILKRWLDSIEWNVNTEIYDFIDHCYNVGADYETIWEISEALGIQ